MAVVTMVPPVMMTPVVTSPVPVVADAARSVIGIDDTAAAIGIVIARRIGRSVVAAIAVEVPAVMVEIRPVGVVRAMMIAAAVECRPRTATVKHGTRTATAEGVTSAAVERRTTAASEHSAAAMEGGSGMEAAASAVETATTAVEATTAAEPATAAAVMSAAASAMAATDLNRESITRCLSRWSRTGTDRRHRRRGPTGCARDQKQCCRRQAEATSKTSALVLHPHHGPFSLNAVHDGPMQRRCWSSDRWIGAPPNMNVEIAT